jgi:hypothetical protein
MNEDKTKLIELGFNVNSRGFIYWLDAINYLDEHPLWWDIMDIYDYVANKHNSTISRVERDMRTAIEPAKKNIQEYYNYTRRIKNVTFLNLLKIERL